MNWMQRAVEDFHLLMHITVGVQPGIPQPQDVDLRIRLLREEVAEYAEAMVAGDLAHAIKELTDVLYVTMGAAVTMGIDIEPFFAEVQRSNMTKLWPDGKPHYDAGGKVVKPDTYSKADIESVLAHHGDPVSTSAVDTHSTGETADET